MHFQFCHHSYYMRKRRLVGFSPVLLVGAERVRGASRVLGRRRVVGRGYANPDLPCSPAVQPSGEKSTMKHCGSSLLFLEATFFITHVGLGFHFVLNCAYDVRSIFVS